MTNYNFRFDAENNKLYFITPSGEEIEISLVTETPVSSDNN